MWPIRQRCYTFRSALKLAVFYRYFSRMAGLQQNLPLFLLKQMAVLRIMKIITALDLTVFPKTPVYFGRVLPPVKLTLNIPMRIRTSQILFCWKTWTAIVLFALCPCGQEHSTEEIISQPDALFPRNSDRYSLVACLKWETAASRIQQRPDF